MKESNDESQQCSRSNENVNMATFSDPNFFLENLIKKQDTPKHNMNLNLKCTRKFSQQSSETNNPKSNYFDIKFDKPEEKVSKLNSELQCKTIRGPSLNKNEN